MKMNGKNLPIWLESGAEATPIAFLNHGDSAIIVDDGCYLIVNRTAGDSGCFAPSAWIFKEALEVLKTLPPLDKP